MKITGNTPFVDLDAYVRNARNEKDTPASGRPASNEGTCEDTVRLSPRAKEIQEAKKLLDSVPDVREEKIVQLKAQIEAGTYQIDAEGTAAKMVRESLLNELL